MKTKILIIEDNYCKFFTIKQVLEAKLKLSVRIEEAESAEEIFLKTEEFKAANVIDRPKGGIVELLDSFDKKKVNRLNTEITLMVGHQLPNRKNIRIDRKGVQDHPSKSKQIRTNPAA